MTNKQFPEREANDKDLIKRNINNIFKYFQNISLIYYCISCLQGSFSGFGAIIHYTRGSYCLLIETISEFQANNGMTPTTH